MTYNLNNNQAYFLIRVIIMLIRIKINKYKILYCQKITYKSSCWAKGKISILIGILL